MVGNHSKSVKAEGSLTARPTSRAGTKVGLSDPVVPHGRAIAQRIIYAELYKNQFVFE